MTKAKKTPSRAEQKRIEREEKRKSIVHRDGTRNTWERICWLSGFMLVLFSLYTFVAIISYLFTWKADLQAWDNANHVVANVGGRVGFIIAHGLMGKSFGLFGSLIPVVGTLFGGFLLLERSRVLWRTLLSIMLITICGSITLAAIPWGNEVFGCGLGGEYGAVVVDSLRDAVGVGLWLILIASWILVLVIININIIDFFKRTTDNGVEQGKGLYAMLKNYFANRRELRIARKKAAELAKLEDDGVEEDDKVRVIGDDASAKESDKTTQIPPVVVPPVVAPASASTPATTTHVAEPDAPTVVAGEPLEGFEHMPNDSQSANDAPKSNIDVVEVYEHTEGQLSAAEINKKRPFNPGSTPDYVFPKVNCLVNHENGAEVSNEEIEQNKQRIEDTLGNFGVPISSMRATIGPTVTLYEIVQEAGVKISKVQGLEKDIAQSLKALGIRIIAPIPGKGTIGIEVPNINKEIVSMRSAIQSERFQNFKAELPVVIGRTIQNENFVFDLAKMPHLLVAGATGQGKSVGLNAIITSLLYRKDPSQLKFVLIDPKTVEFSLYDKLEKHFLAKMASEDEAIVKDPKKAIYTLNSLCVEMENRLAKCGSAGVRNIVEYNEKVRKREVEDDILPYIVVIIDEFADLIMTAKEVEKPVMRLAQKARAIGIHLIVATQRPDVKVITGTIKANFPARIAFRVMQMIDSRTIIDQPGAQQLIGRGDMLMSVNGEITRIQCAYVDTPEVHDIVEHISNQPFPYPSGTYLLPDYEDSGAAGSGEANIASESGAPRQFDEYFAAVARDAVASGRLSTSSIQSVYNVGFSRAGRITRQLEQAGIVGPLNGSKPRDAKIHDMMELEQLLHELGVE